MARKYLDSEGMNIARGLIRYTTGDTINGSVPAMSQNQTGTIWDINDTTYPWEALASANNLTFTVSNSGDVGATVTVYGLDSNRDQITETVTLSAQTGVSTTNQFKRINKAIFKNGSGSQNLGAITIGNGGSTAVGRIRLGNGATQAVIYSIPNGHQAFITQGTCSVQAGADASGKFFVRDDGQPNFVLAHTFEVSGAGGQYKYDFTTPFVISANSDIEVEATVRSNNARVTAAFDLILIDQRNN